MARGDPIFARVDISLMNDPRFRKLSGAQKWFYITCYLCAVESRSELLPSAFDLTAICDRSGIDTKTARKALEKSVKVGLLEEPAQGRICVMGVRENHLRLEWKELSLDSPCEADTGPKREENKTEKIEEKREQSKEPDTPQKLVAGIIKSLNHSSEPELPEIEPDEERMKETRKMVLEWGIGDLVRYTATLTKTGKLTNTLNTALRDIPERDLREICIYVLAKMGANTGRGWTIKKSGAVLTARCKKLTEGKV